MIRLFFTFAFVAESSLLIHYKFWTSFGQAFKDFSGNGNHAVNGDTTAVEASDAIPTSRGLYMNGSKVKLPPNELVPAGFNTGTKYSIVCWVKYFSADFYVYEKDFGLPKYLRWRHYSSMMHIEMDEGTGWQWLHCSISNVYNRWEFMVVTVDMSSPTFHITMPVSGFTGCYDSGTLYHYVDNPSIPTTMGKLLKGVIYEFRFYNHLLTSTEIAALAVSSGTGGCSCAVKCAIEPAVTCLSSCSTATTLSDCTTNCSCGTSACAGSDTTCITCHPTCKKSMCIGLTYQDCVLGQNCAAPCASCSGLTENECLTCVDPNTVLSNGVCSCADTFYLSSPSPFVCSPCSPFCKTCSGSTDSDCQTCHPSSELSAAAPSSCVCSIGYFADPSPDHCSACADSCKTCSSLASDSCLTCYDPAVLSGPAPNTCICPSTHFPSPTAKNCQTCHATCETCALSIATGCLTCYNFASLDGPAPSSCICNKGYFLINGKCSSCNATCETCANAETKGCLTCRTGSTLSGPAPGYCNCATGFYLDNGLCLPCNDSCATCKDDSACTSCKTNATLKNNICVCNEGFFGLAASCHACPTGCGSCSEDKCDKCGPGLVAIGPNCIASCPPGSAPTSDGACESGSPSPPVPAMSVADDNSLMVTFDKEMNCTVSEDDISIQAQASGGGAVDVTWQEPKFQDKQTLVVVLQFQESWLDKGCMVTLSFLYPDRVVDVYGFPIEEAMLTGVLHEFGEKPTETTTTAVLLQSSAAQQAAATSKGGVSAGVATSFLNGSPAGLISMINQLQLITYLAMTKLPLPADFAGSLAAMNIGSMVPNPLSGYFQHNDTTQTPPTHVQDYGIDSTLFITNSLTFLGTCLLILSSYLPIYLLARARLGFISVYFSKLLPSFRWGVPVRLWLTSYLDLGVFSLLQLSNKHGVFAHVLAGFSTVAAGLTALCFALTPLWVIFFTCRYFNRISSRGDDLFNRRWGTLFLEFREGQDLSSVAYYSIFTIRRAVLACTLVLLDDQVAVIALLNTSLCVLSLMFLIFCRPFESRLDQSESIVLEASTTSVYVIASCFLLSLGDKVKSIMTAVGVWTVRAAIGANVAMSLIRTVLSVVTLVKLYKNRMDLVKMKYQVQDFQKSDETRTAETNSTQKSW